MQRNARYVLKTIGHATLLLLEDGVPLLATDPWLVGSAYWRSWWLEKYPTEQELALVRNSRFLYVTHSHPDHFHWPTLRALGPREVLNPLFPRYDVPEFLERNGFSSRILEPWQWYTIGGDARIASIPCPIDDSVLVVDTPRTTIVNLNDSAPTQRTLRRIRGWLPAGKRVVMLKSYSPASAAVSTFRDGVRAPLKTKRDFTLVAQTMAQTLGAAHFIPFASQAFFSRQDSRWANEYKVAYEDLLRHWSSAEIELCKPFTTMDLATAEHTSEYSGVKRELAESQLLRVAQREQEEAAFELPPEFDAALKNYLDEVRGVSLLFRRGIGWKLASSGQERFYRTRTRTVEPTIPADYDLVITLPDQVLAEALRNGVLTDLGITMFLRVDTRVSVKVAYLSFLLMGLRDYGYFKSLRAFAKFVWFYLPHFAPLSVPRPASGRAISLVP